LRPRSSAKRVAPHDEPFPGKSCRADLGQITLIEERGLNESLFGRVSDALAAQESIKAFDGAQILFDALACPSRHPLAKRKRYRKSPKNHLPASSK
jgi:hypothetical protein